MKVVWIQILSGSTILYVVNKYRNNVPMYLIMTLDKLLGSLDVELNSEHTIKKSKKYFSL